ncbi:lipoprotein [Caballeronia sordidicola]|uniref:Lipoprotein n=1 Tax=Caballeronia sordidicola TaxID=196367 RepID=A0A158FYV8_CABSO|nr:entericidin A/B family lipoprotein [Caballeronia sordidicola]SAL24350.1 lipoprotein [Caballeronia sordidicola]
MKRVAIWLALMGVVLGAAACNTVHGFGEDMRATGNAISNAVK